MTNEKEKKDCWVHLQIPEEVGQKVRKEANELHITKSAYIRLVLCEFFKAKEEK